MNKTKLWEKEKKTDSIIERFTIGNDQSLDMLIAPFDVIASKAHAKMLSKVGLISNVECEQLLQGLNEIESLLSQGKFKIEEGVEDIHSQIEFYLTKKYGETGKKIHTARSRNDQVLTAIKLYLKHELQIVDQKTKELIQLFYQLSAKHKGILLPGYTHFQIAMPSSFDIWLSAYAESLGDDIELLNAAYKICDKNPLGSGAGYGSSFPIDREFTTKEMGFATLNKSSVYAQMTRGKSEKVAAIALSSIAHTISKFSYDVCLYLCQNFGFISFPENLTTGSSIMPHKKNPDVFELLRAKCNVLQGLPNQLTLLTNNLPSGYHRDMQLTKELIFPAFSTLKECLDVLIHTLPQLEVNQNCMNDEKYDYCFSVEEVNKLVLSGISFRDAYQIIAGKIKSNEFMPERTIDHSHTGSIGN
ncbi:MAG: argininosuccinate lyase [Sphingobacteriaceae bacterium]|nr:argininosuccinate lyase [Sphingobacteriaceae bacterium]